MSDEQTPVGDAAAPANEELLSAGDEPLPVSDGFDALLAPGAFDPLFSLLEAGGPVVVILLVLSVIALAIVLLKLWQFAALQTGNRDFIRAALSHWRAGRRGEALSILAGTRNPIARVMEIAIQGQAQGRFSEDKVREEAARVGAAHLEDLRSHLRGLEVIATLSPLLGLLGTVLGMIEAFQRLEEAGSRVDPAILSGGIWEALLTTAAGLMVAIPAVIALNWFERKIDRLNHHMEDAATQVFTVELTTVEETSQPLSWGAPRTDHAY